METIELMSEELINCLVKAGVREDVLASLREDELNTVELLEATSDSLFKQCGIKVGQIIRLRNGIRAHKDNHNQDSETVSPFPPLPTMSRTRSVPTMSPQVQPSSPSPQHSSSCLSSNYTPSTPSTSRSPSPINIEQSPLPSFGESFTVQSPDGKWLKSFKLPTKFAPGISAGLEAGKLSSIQRNEFTRDICSAIQAHSLFPTKLEREHVAMMIVRKYPFLEDKMGSGIFSWEQAIKFRFKNVRKTKRPVSSRPAAKQDVQETVKPKKVKKLDTGRIPELPEGETEETCKEHMRLLKKEMTKTANKNVTMIKQLMDVTYAIRRKSLLLEPRAIDEVLKEYPALGLMSELKAEFSRIMDDASLIRKMTCAFKDSLKQKVLKLARKKNPSCNVLKSMEEAIQSTDGIQSSVEEIAAMMLLPSLLKDRSSGRSNAQLLKICTEDESIDDLIAKALVPELIASGDMETLSCMYVAAEGKIVCRLNPKMQPAQALAILIACYYVYNIEYPASLSNVYLFLEAVVMDKPCEAKKRVTINKFMLELE